MALVHLSDSRRPEGSYYSAPDQMKGQVVQYPVICALDVVEQDVTMRSRREQVVTCDPKAATCPDCRCRVTG